MFDWTDLKIWIRTFDQRIQWLIKWGIPITLLIIGVIVLGVFTETLGQTWDLLSGTQSPSKVVGYPHWIAYVVSIAGYIIVPGFIGVAVALVVSLQRSSYRRPQSELDKPNES